MTGDEPSPASGLEPPHTYDPKTGYSGLRDGNVAAATSEAPADESWDENDEDDEDFLDEDEDSGVPLGSAETTASKPTVNVKARIDDELQSLAKHASKLKLKDIEPGSGSKTGDKDRSDRATSEQVLDPRTRMILLQLLNRNIVSEINGVLSTGKEANVYHALTIPQDGDIDEAAARGEHRAIKVYKTSILVFKD